MNRLEINWKKMLQVTKFEIVVNRVSKCWKKHPDAWKLYPDALKRYPDTFIFQLQNDEQNAEKNN